MRLSALRIACSTRKVGNIGATLEHHEAILRSHILIAVGLCRFRARRSGPGPCHELLGKRGSIRLVRQYRQTSAFRPLRRRSNTNSIRQQRCFSRSRLHCGRHRIGRDQPQGGAQLRPNCDSTQRHCDRPIFRNQARGGRVVKREFRIHDPSSGSARILIAQLRNEDASTERGGYSCSHGAQSPCAPNRPPLQ